MTATQHDETEQFIANLRNPKHRRTHSKKTLPDEERFTSRETSPAPSRHEKQHSGTAFGGFDRRGKSAAILDLPIRELQTQIASMDTTPSSQRTMLRSTSPDQMYSTRQDTYTPREAYTARERRRSPLGNKDSFIWTKLTCLDTEDYIPRSPNTRRRTPKNKADKDLDSSALTGRSTVESIQQE